MAAFDSILNIDEWISDHYFTTDEGESFSKRVTARAKEWAALEKETGTLSPIKRLQQHRDTLQTAFATSADTADAATTDALVRTAFGYGAPVPKHYTRAGEQFHYNAWHGNAGTVIVISAEPDAAGEVTEADLTTLPVAGGVSTEGKDPEPAKVSKLVGDLFLSEDPPEFLSLIHI